MECNVERHQSEYAKNQPPPPRYTGCNVNDADAKIQFDPTNQLRIHLVTLIPNEILSPTRDKFEKALQIFYSNLLDNPVNNIDTAIAELQNVVLPAVPTPNIEWKVTIATWMLNLAHLRKQNILTDQIHLLKQIESTIDLLRSWSIQT